MYDLTRATRPPLPSTPDRWLHFDGAHNVRDLGGLPLHDGGVVDCGKIVRGDTVVHLSPTGVEQLHAYGIRTVLDLRSPQEIDSDGVGHMSALYDAGDVVWDNVSLLTAEQWHSDQVGRTRSVYTIAESYYRYLEGGGAALARALREGLARGGVYVHCAVGKDRTGVVAALVLDLAGVAHPHIAADYDLTTERLVPTITRLGARPAYQRDLSDPDWDHQRPNPDALTLMLEEVARNGGSAQWLTDNGLSETDIDGIRSTLTYYPAP